MSEINFDCKVCEHCMRAMTAKQYHEHSCTGIVPEIQKKWEIKPVANVKEENEDKYIKLEEQLVDARYELDDLCLEEEVIQDKIRDKENEISDLEDMLAELEEEQDDSDN